MTALQREDLLSLENYAQQRPVIRAEMMAIKRDRQLQLGEHIRLLFENALTIRYQIQEMLRIEKLFEAAAIQDELDAYNPLIPDGHNWKCTMMIEFSDPAVRRRELARLLGIEQKLWLAVDGFAPVYPVANEDLERSTAEKTASVHFLRFELSADMVQAVITGSAIVAGVDHDQYRVAKQPLPEALRNQLMQDLRP